MCPPRNSSDSGPLDVSTQHLLRTLAPQVLGILVRRFGDFRAAEDAVQESLLAAATHWPDQGIPESPKGWLVRVASRRFIDLSRSEVARRRREELVVSLVPPEHQLAVMDDEAPDQVTRDETLELLFLCCHPSLTPSSAIALTLRAVGGLTTAEIATAFLVPEPTMAQRISRAKQRIKDDGARFESLSGEERITRLGSVLHVLYLIFNEGYAASSGESLTRTDLSSEALRLTRILQGLLPDDGEVAGLLALMLLTDARRRARSGPDGELIPLDRQDRSLWDANAITEGVALVTRTLSRGSVGSYQLQAAIAAVHDEAPSAEDTDWAEILGLYGLLLHMSDNPMVALNHAIALSMVHGPAAGLERLDSLAKDARISGHHRLTSVRAHLLERAGQTSEAIAHYQRAAGQTSSTAERNYLLMQAARLKET